MSRSRFNPPVWYSNEEDIAPILQRGFPVKSTDDAEDMAVLDMPDRATLAQPDFARNRFPCAVVFQPFPPLAWVCPFIGHMGITDSSGAVLDFQGPYAIGRDHMMLGDATMYLPLDPRKVMAVPDRGWPTEQHTVWDCFVAKGVQEYSCRFHNLLCDNCNHHVARTLKLMQYEGLPSWIGSWFGMFYLWVWVCCRGKFVGKKGLILTVVPFFVVASLFFYWRTRKSVASM